MHLYAKKIIAGLGASAMTLLPAAPAFADGSHSQDGNSDQASGDIFQENVSFDHYFATYPNAQPNLDKSVYFRGKAGTPTVNGLTGPLLTNNPTPATRKRRQCDQPIPAGPFTSLDLRPGPQLRSRAAGFRRRSDGHVSGKRRGR